jgi:hypothetical protein
MHLELLVAVQVVAEGQTLQRVRQVHQVVQHFLALAERAEAVEQ